MYTSLHNHTMYSNLRLLDCINKPSRLLDRALELNLNGLAITDHACLSSHVEIQQYYDKLKSQDKIPSDFKLILGDEIYLTTDLNSKGEYYHQILLAKDEIGHKLLREIETKAWKNSYNYKNMDRVPITFQEVSTIIEKNKGHLITTSACLGSFLGKKVIQWKELERSNYNNKDIQEIKNQIHSYISWNIRNFGEDFYLEIQPSDTTEQIVYNEGLKQLSKAYNIPLVFSTDSHYLKSSDRYFHECFLNSKDGDREVQDFYKTTYLLTFDEIKEYLSVNFTDNEIEQMRLNTNAIGEKCEYYSLYKPQKVPTCKFDLSTVKEFKTIGYEYIDKLLNSCNEDKYWIRYCLQELENKKLWCEEYLERLNIESEQLYLISEKMGQHLSSYFILMQKVIKVCWNYSLVGIGRGSSVGWLSNYLMDITGIDPVKFGLNTWWRFAHESRPELAD